MKRIDYAIFNGSGFKFKNTYKGVSDSQYNYFRTYDPSTGRYVESGPIGLAGELNTYDYASGNPLRFIDPVGKIDFEPPIDPNNPKLDPNNPPKPKPPGKPGVQQPEPVKPGTPRGRACELIVAACLAKCIKAPICKAPRIGPIANSWLCCILRD